MNPDSKLERNLKIAGAILGFAVLLSGLWLWKLSSVVSTGKKLGLISLGQIPQFQLMNQQGKPFVPADLKGKISLVAFVYTRCGTSCPLITSQMVGIQKKFKNNPDFQLVSITVDPKHDTPQVLERYARSYGADTKNWSFVTGEPDTIFDLIEGGFKVPVQRMEVFDDGKNIDIPHSTSLLLVDRQGNIWGIFEGVLESDWTRLDNSIAAFLSDRNA